MSFLAENKCCFAGLLNLASCFRERPILSSTRFPATSAHEVQWETEEVQDRIDT